MSQFSKKLRYAFDNTMSKGPIALIMWLAIISLLVIIIASIILMVTGIHQPEEPGLPFIEAAWQSLMRTLDSGTVGGDTGWGFRIIMLIVTIGGIFIASTLIGILSSGIEGKLEELRKGRSEVMEEDFTLILGWSSKVYTIIGELVMANENQKKPRIVILSGEDKVEMEDAIKINVPDTKNTKVICRSGDTTNPVDLNIANPKNAKSIIILGKDAHESDFEIIKTILAITNNPERKTEPYHIVAEMREVHNFDVARMIAKDEAELILTDDIVARIMVQTSRQSGLSVVYTELMDYGGDEIYYKNEPTLAGKTYAEALLLFDTSCIMGLQQNGISKINPPMDTVIQENDNIIVISADDDTIVLNNKSVFDIDEPVINNATIAAVKKVERIILLGWNRRVIRVIKELNNYVGKGSIVHVVANNPLPDELDTKQTAAYENLTIEYTAAETSDRKVLESIDVFHSDYVMLFSYELDNDIQRSDAITLITLLHLRDMSEKANRDLNIVSEMLDLKNRELAEVTNTDDFIVSDKMLSLLITQVSENKHLMRVFEDILDEEGSEIYMKPITDYITTDKAVDAYTLTAAGVIKGHTVIGYRIMADQHNAANAYGIKLNPEKPEKIKFSLEDKLIVLADD